MPMIYTVAPGSNLTTSGTPSTEVDHLFVAAGVRNVGYQAIFGCGKGAALTAISGIAIRGKHFGTASTGGTAITPKPKDPGMQASKATAAHTPTAGSAQAGGYFLAFGFGAAGPGGWVAANPDSIQFCEGGSGDSLDLYSASATASLNFEISAEIVE
jgi:hypothetical protein